MKLTANITRAAPMSIWARLRAAILPSNVISSENLQSQNIYSDANAPPPLGRLRRSTLVMLRWMAVAGQTAALLLVYFGFGFSFAVGPALIFIALSICLNLAISFLWPLDRGVRETEAIGHLSFDVSQLSALLWLTGGMSNPFALLLIAPVATGATTLSRGGFFLLMGLSVLLSLVLLFSSQPLPWDPAGGLALPFLFRFGIWAALMTGMSFTALYAWQVAHESRRMSEALAATEAVLAYEQKLSALGSMAAAAAHELGTPLATIQLTAKEMQRSAAHDPVLAEDLALVISQTSRCRDILKQLARRGDETDLIHDNLSLNALLEEASSPFCGFEVTIHSQMIGRGPESGPENGGPKASAPEPIIVRRAELMYGLRNLIENATGFARANVWLTARWDAQHIWLRIEDDGPGFDPALAGRLGEPFISHRPDNRPNNLQAGGMGLGMFIAKTLIERTGGKLEFNNRSGGGAQVDIVWPAEKICSPKNPSNSS